MKVETLKLPNATLEKVQGEILLFRLIINIKIYLNNSVI